jgi:predicted ATPase/DNA-binding SARP family transcriptional activator/class 3 adenylate cyclase
METLWRLELLGGLRVIRGEQSIVRFRTQKTAALLAYLAYFRERAHPREVLTEVLWPEDDVEAARHKLRVAISSLRHQLEPPGIPAGAVIAADRFTVRLNPATTTTDVADFRGALESASAAPNRVAATERLADAVELYRGPLLPGFYEEWIMPEQQRLAEEFYQAARQLARYWGEAGDYARALDSARRAVNVDSLREEAHRELIQLLAAAGRTEEALRQYRELEQLLKCELGSVPSPATRLFADKLRLQAGSGGSVGSVGSAGRTAHTPHTPHTPHTAPTSHTPRSLPAGTVTILLADLRGGGGQQAQPGEAPGAAQEEARALLQGEFERFGGAVEEAAPDSFLVGFSRPSRALACAVACQRRLSIADCGLRSADSGIRGNPQSAIHNPQWKVRIALHTGEVDQKAGEYHGGALHWAARVVAAAHPGQILCSEAAAAVVRRDLEPDMRLVDLGTFMLAEARPPERLFGVEWPGMDQGDFPPPSAQAVRSNRLPVQLTRFFGREAEIERLADLVSPGKSMRSMGTMGSMGSAGLTAHTSHTPHTSHTAARLVTLTGPGGTGKTRLAVEVAERLVEPYRGAVWFVSLADLTEPRLIPGAMVDALNLPRSPSVDPLEQVVTALSRQPSLLVLDNFDVLVEEGSETVRVLLERVPDLSCLVASRQPLNLSGEREFPVLPLPVPGVSGSQLPVARAGEAELRSDDWKPETLAECPSVQLFVDRAQAVRPDFQVTPFNASAIAELCERLEGIPLALELAAARAQVLTPTQMLAQLERRFDFLVSRRRDVAARHRTLRAAIDWSYHLLPTELQRFFRQLSVFRGGFSIEAAAVVTADDADIRTGEGLALEALEELRARSLVIADERGPEMRFRMLETLREYGAEELTPEEAKMARQRHAEYFLALAERAEPECRGPQQSSWFDLLEIEHDNLRAALEWSLSPNAEWGVRSSECPGGSDRSDGPDKSDASVRSAIEAGLQLAGSLVWFWLVRNHWKEARRWLDRALERGEESRTSGRARALCAAGWLAWRERETERAIRFAEEGLALCTEIDDSWGAAFSLLVLGLAAHLQGNQQRAVALMEEASARSQAAGEPWLMAQSMHLFGVVLSQTGAVERAVALQEESVARLRQVGDRWNLACALRSLGHTYGGDLCDYARARALHLESLEVFQELNDQWGIASTLLSLGTLARFENDLPQADAVYNQALPLVRAIGDRYDMAHCLHNMGHVARSLEQFEVAWERYRESIGLFRDLGYRSDIAFSLEGFSGLASAQGQFERSVRLRGAAETLREAAGIPLPEIDREQYDHYLDAARAALGEERFERAWAAGRAMTPEQAVEEALQR